MDVGTRAERAGRELNVKIRAISRFSEICSGRKLILLGGE